MQIHKIAIIDDEEQSRETLAETLQLIGFEPFIVQDTFTKVSDLAAYIKKNAQAVICDHRLSDRGLAPFTGAELMPLLYRDKVPSLLMTQYTETDINVSIRKYRESIPIVIGRDDLVDLYDLDRIGIKFNKGFETCSQEFQGIMSSIRRPHRTLINIVDITTDSGEDVVEVFIPSWNPYRAVRFPISQIPKEIMTTVRDSLDRKEEACLFACVNTGADKADDLYFTRFEIAPELDENDGLA
jgi:CheY-like chemotaxis protein